MKTSVLALVGFVITVSSASAQYNNAYGGSYGAYGTGSNSSSHSTSGYIRNNGTYVQPHQQTNPNNTQMDNYSTRGNFNPYTGHTGTRTPRY